MDNATWKCELMEELKLRKAEMEREKDVISNSQVLLVGCGGIGCEVLKNLVVSHFTKIHIFDLDTIEVSNLNRQFLFQSQHVGKPKCVIAKQSVLKFNANSEIVTYHDSIISEKYNVSFFKQFAVVINALDNRSARNHVNRLCLAADVPLVESGSAGFAGQTYVIKKGVSECYECIAKSAKEKTYPTCTVRNTPSEPIHCIVWAKQLFHQLFGEVDAEEDNEVSPDNNDQEAQQNQDQTDENLLKEYGEKKVSTREWAMSVNYNPVEIIKKLFIKDVQYLLTMKNLWLKRTAPIPLKIDSDQSDSLNRFAISEPHEGFEDNKVWDVDTCLKVFTRSVMKFCQRKTSMGDNDQFLAWDKDDDDVIDFTSSAANIRCHIFSIPGKSRFDVKSMAGNIIPAIATTNAIVAGLMVNEAKKAMMGKFDQCRLVFLKRQPTGRKGNLFQSCPLAAPNPNCYVCSSKSEIILQINCTTFLIKTFLDKVLKKTLSMVEPDVELIDGKGTILISSEPEDNLQNLDKTLQSFNVTDGTRLKADDFFQNFTVIITIQHCDKVCDEDRSVSDDQNFQLVGLDSLTPPTSNKDDVQQNGKPSSSSEAAEVTKSGDGECVAEAKSVNDVVMNRKEVISVDDDDDVDECDVNGMEPEAKKLKLDSSSQKTEEDEENSDDSILVLD